jgi:hypothetical protein
MSLMDAAAVPEHLLARLQPFEAAARAAPEVLGVLYTGSLGRGTCDRFSDLDIVVWTTDDAVEQGQARVREVMGWLGEVQFIYGRGEAFATGFVGVEWRRVDLYLKRQTELTPDPEYAEARVVKDTGGFLARLVAESPAEVVTVTWEQARAALEEAIDSQVYLALHNARGAVWSAMGEISYRCTELYTLLAALRGHRTYGFRAVEALLSPEEQALLTAAWPGAPTRDEVRRAGRALWDWSRHVRREAERILGRPLEIAVDEAGLLAAVDRIYTWE